MENKYLPLSMPERSPSSGKAQHSDELRVYICHARPKSCTAHTWMSTTKGHLVPLHGDSALPHPGACQGAGQAPSGEGQDRLSSLFPTEETATAALEIQVGNLSGENAASSTIPAWYTGTCHLPTEQLKEMCAQASFRSPLSVFACRTASRELFLLSWKRGSFSEPSNRQRHKDMRLSSTC